MTAAHDFTIRPARPEDAAALGAIQLHSALRAYRGIFPPGAPQPTLAVMTASWELELAADDAASFVAELDGTPAGGVVASADGRRDGFGHLRKLYVAPDRWHLGAGRALHDAAVGWLAQVGVAEPVLWVLTGNQRARELYERWGWMLDEAAIFTHAGLDVTEVRYRHRFGRKDDAALT